MIYHIKLAAHVLLIIALLSIIMLAISFWLDMDVQEAQAAEIPLSSRIVVGPRVLVTWDKSTDSVRVLGYHVAAFLGPDSVTAGADAADTSAVIDVSGIVPDSAISRVRFVVRAYNQAGMSAPSDTVSLPMRKAPLLFGDLNHDGKVDVLDSALLWSRGIVGTVRGMPGYSSEMDIDADGDVDVRDHLYFVYNIGQTL